VFELLEVAVFDLLHEGLALQEVALEVGGELAGNDEELVGDSCSAPLNSANLSFAFRPPSEALHPDMLLDIVDESLISALRELY
jgi:hypothetical protein